MRERTGWGIATALAVIAAIVAVGGAEFFLRFSDPANMRAGWTTWTEVDPSAPALSYANQLGYRGQPINTLPGDFVIVLVGDSQLECRACRDHNLPEDMLRGALAAKGRHVKVFSVGPAGYGADQELLALRRYFRMGFRADLVIVWQTLDNDLFNAVYPNMAPVFGAGKLKPTFRLAANGELVEPSGDIGEPFCSVYLVCVYRQIRYGSMDAYFEQWLPPPVQPISAPLPNAPLIDTDESIDYEKSTWALWLREPSARSRYAIALTRALYKSMSELAAGHGAGFAVLDINRMTSIALDALKSYPFFADGPKTVRRSGKLYAIGGYSTYLRTGRALNEGFPLIRVDMDIADHVASPSDGHLNERGTGYAMKGLAAALAGRIGQR
ncbi:MAG: SGNH/GDSL hydrolase family protein [Alphaproteobacteria bacterium]|nr:MAG: SGNH/GDSL hydrolase family protein [Alphaproteobacteria bacterium]